MDQKETPEKRGNLNDSLYFLYMKSLKESLFDPDIVTNSNKVGHQLKDQVFYDGESLIRLKGHYNFDMLVGLPGWPHALGLIDWKKVRQDLKKFGGKDIDLGDYAHYNTDKYKIHNTDTKLKTEAFARLILSIRTAEECQLNSYNSRFRDELSEKLNEYLVEKTGTGAPTKNLFHFDVETKRDQIDVVLWHKGYDRSLEVIRWEFLKLRDE